MNSDAYEKQDGGQLRIVVKENQITVAPGGSVTLQAAIINGGANEAYLAMRVKGVPDAWITINTPVVQVAAGETKLVTLAIQPAASADNRAVQYALDIYASSQTDMNRSAQVRILLTVAAYQSKGRIGVMLGSVHFSAVPGKSTNIPVVLRNRGEEEDSFRLVVSGLPANWILLTSSLIRLKPNSSTEVELILQIPRSPRSTAGRTRFTIQVVSQLFASQSTEVECLLTISAFSKFSVSLEPGTVRAGEFGNVIVSNEGNTTDTYSLIFQGWRSHLIFEKTVQVVSPDTQQVGIGLVEIAHGERISVQPGERGSYPFRARLRSRPMIGSERSYPFGVEIRSTSGETIDISSQLHEAAWVPAWLVGGILASGVIGFLILCILFVAPPRNLPTASRATQTAASNLTQTVLAVTGDADGDGLTDEQEAAVGTDPLKSDTDGDRLPDREEIETFVTNPLDPDTDDDGLQDGDEVQTYQTDPRAFDVDNDGVSDGDEIVRGLDPRNPDSDSDGGRDGDEIGLGTDPRNPDTDGDGLRDGDENANCPHPRDPDSDDDGIIDGRDLDACNASNPALTATAAAAAAQATAAAPTITPTITPTFTPPPPNLDGVLLFDSNRTGNSEIYSFNLANQVLTRVTNSTAQDVQPALAPDSIQVAYVTNQDSNNEIYLTGIDGRTPVNLTSNPGDDQQPAWSPDGNWIAFTTARDGDQEIYVMRRDGTEVHNLTNHPGNDFAPTWFSVGSSPNTQDWIAFTTTRDGNQEIYKMRPDGSGLTNLTQNPANDYSPAGFAGGSILAFVSERNGNSEIYVMTDTGGTQSNVTNNSTQDLDPSINPGGNWIAFSTDRDGNLEIYVIRIDGGSAFNVTKDISQDRHPDW